MPEELASTDFNLPISLGIPALTIGCGGKNDGQHSLGEWFDPRDAYIGPQRHFLMVLGLVGIDGVSAPILPGAPRAPDRARWPRRRVPRWRHIIGELIG